MSARGLPLPPLLEAFGCQKFGCENNYSPKWFLWNYTLNDLFIWLQHPKFITMWRLYNLCSQNFVIQGNLGLLTLLIKGLIVLKLQVQTGGGYSLCNQIFWYGHPLGWPYEDFEGGARYFLMILTSLMDIDTGLSCFLKLPALGETYVASGAAEWFIFSVDSVMFLQIAWCWAFVVTLGAAEWFITSVDSFMCL